MTQEEKQLLLIDLCARLPYGVKCNVGHIIVTLEGITENGEVFADGSYFDVYDMKPYLRPMSSMTKEESMEYLTVTRLQWNENDEPYRELTIKALDWLNAHHFDYRGLIEKGLALEAPENMYKTE